MEKGGKHLQVRNG